MPLLRSEMCSVHGLLEQVYVTSIWYEKDQNQNLTRLDLI